MSEVTYRASSNISFIVQNISNKKLRIFNYPIYPGQTRDLMKIPAISENDIRDSLLKGQLQFMLSVLLIRIVFTDVDLTQINAAQRSFLESGGATTAEPINFTNIKTLLGSASSAVDLNSQTLSGLGKASITFPSQSPVTLPSIMSDSSLILWLDPGVNPTVSAVTQLASQINDRSSNANHGTATSTAQPITNGQIFAGAPGYNLDGAATFLTLTSQITTARTIIMAYQSAGLPPANTPILGSTVASATTDFAGSASGVAMFLVGGVGTNLADGKVDINGRRYIMRDAPGVYYGPARPTSPSIVTITGTGSLRFDTISKDRGNSRWDKANHGMLCAFNRVLTIAEQWAAERWMANELRARGAALPLDINRRKLVIFEGDSQTFGGSAYYPDYIFGDGTSKGFYGSNVAQAGTCVGSKDGLGGAYPANIGTPFMLNRQAANVLSLYQSTADTNIVVFRGGTNDLANGAGKVQTLANVLAWHDAARTAGFKTIAVPMLDRTSAMPNYIGSDGFTADRNWFNTQLRASSSHYDAILPVAYDSSGVMANGAPDSLTYFDADKLHPNKVGQQMFASYLASVLNEML